MTLGISIIFCLFLLLLVLHGSSQSSRSTALKRQADDLREIDMESRRQADFVSDAYVNHVRDYLRENTRR